MADNSSGGGPPKWTIWAGGIASIATVIAVMYGYGLFHPSPSPPNPTPTISTAAGTSTSNAPWNVILNSTTHYITFNGYTAPVGMHYIVVVASFSNVSSESQTLSGSLFDLQDSTGQHYQEDQASNPGQSFAVDPGKSIQTYTAFLVPDSQCSFELSFIAGSSIVSQWTISSTFPGC